MAVNELHPKVLRLGSVLEFECYLTLDVNEGLPDTGAWARQFAQEILVPRIALSRLLAGGTSRQKMIAFAETIGVAPGIVVGRLSMKASSSVAN